MIMPLDNEVHPSSSKLMVSRLARIIISSKILASELEGSLVLAEVQSVASKYVTIIGARLWIT